MIKRIVILGSTGSIGRSTLEVISKDRKNFNVVLITANNNYKKLIKQAKKFKAKNVLIKNQSHYRKVKDSLKNFSTKVYTGDIPLKKIISKKVDFTMTAIVGIAGLQPTLEAVRFSKTLALANKESIICGWSLISKQAKKFKTKIVPVDSEHFSIMELTKNVKDEDIEEIIITASGGPFLKTTRKKLKIIKPREAINHPKWKMGKKISVDSANLMNKVFELIEAYRIFNFDKKKYKIIIHPQSYFHSIVRFRNGLIKMLLYNTDMKIPISNILYEHKNHFQNVKNINIKTFNDLTFYKVNKNKFPSIKLISKCLNGGLLTSTIINASNEVLVNMFLSKKISFLDIVKNINKILRDKDFKKYARRKPKTIKDIKMADNWARLKTVSMCVR